MTSIVIFCSQSGRGLVSLCHGARDKVANWFPAAVVSHKEERWPSQFSAGHRDSSWQAANETAQAFSGLHSLAFRPL